MGALLRLLVGAAALLSACGDGPGSGGSDAGADAGPPEPVRTSLTVGTATAVTETDPRYLSFAVDAAQVVGGLFWDTSGEVEPGAGANRVEPYDFTRPRLRALAAELSPALLRIGGSEADRIYYALGDAPPAEPPEPYAEVLTRAQWDGVGELALDLGFDLMFTLNAGPGPRADDGSWSPDQARLIIEHSVARGWPVEVWELGNEPNGFRYIHGGFTIEGDRLAADFGALRMLLDEVAPEARLGGPASAFWPEVGEIAPVFPDFMEAGGGTHLDVVTWHYYPQQSRRCPVAVRRATPTLMLEPPNLDEVHTWAAQVESERDAHAAGAEVWLGESGHAQCGGEPGVSDTFAGSFWWLDQLGLLARRGQRVVVRQTLSGSNYGLLDDATLDPSPDYWASVLWKRLMGTRVLDVQGDGDAHLRAYAHCTAGDAPGSVTVLLINLHLAAPAIVEGLSGSGQLYHLTADDLFARTVALNGTRLVDRDGVIPPLEGQPLAEASRLELPPTSYAFVVLPDAAAAGCM